MTLPIGLDPDLIRAFTYIADEGSFTRAAERVGRTQSAVSMQVQRLEAALGEKLFARGKGGAVQLTPQGHFLLERARSFLALNDEIWNAFRTPRIQGVVRLGSPDDYALRYLPPILRRFADTHPSIDVEVVCLPSCELIDELRDGNIDLSLISEGHQPHGADTVELWRGPLSWVTSDRHTPHRLDPLPLSLARGGCSWREAAIAAVERTGRRYRVAYNSASQLGTHAPVLAGLAVTVSTISWLPEGLRRVRPDEGLPPLPDFGILLMKGRTPSQPVTDVLATHIAEHFRQESHRQDRPRAA